MVQDVRHAYYGSLYIHRRLRQQPPHPILSSVAPHMPHRPSSARLLSSNLSVTPSPEGALYTSCLQSLSLPVRTSRLPSVTRAQQQGPGQECDANAEGGIRTAVVESQTRDGGTRVESSRASLPDSAVAKRCWKLARGIARTVVGGMRGGHRSLLGALLRALLDGQSGRLLEMGWGAVAVGVRIEVYVDGLARGWARTRVGRAMSQRGRMHGPQRARGV